jgi:hypothetical protein
MPSATRTHEDGSGAPTTESELTERVVVQL